MSNLATFHNLGLNSHLLQAVLEAGYIEPTPIQTQTIPPILARRDLVGCAQTGTGKTAAFALPILQLLAISSPESHQSNSNSGSHNKKPIRVLVLSPTRELAIQIGDFFTKYGKFSKKLTNTVIYGGVKQHQQVKALTSGVDVLIATPGRLLDLIGQGYVSLQHIEILVFDEADHMLDMGFIPDVRRIMKTVSKEHQTMLFSATMPEEIVQMAKNFLNKPVKVSVNPNQPVVEIIDQTVYFVEKANKQALLLSIVSNPKVERALVFSRTKHGANKIVKKLLQDGVEAEPIHGNKSQNARQKALQNFRDGTTRILVATDVAARGIDVVDISHVIQFDLPNVSETYVHRIGRTGRAGANGIAIAFCDHEERPFLIDIQKLIRRKIPVASNAISIKENTSNRSPLNDPLSKQVNLKINSKKSHRKTKS
ncbi:MAG: DEAD/DEAH box helicase [Promethearchaeota archaeon]|nr:MAG: DEAD/DEAH box helicase [Candidatus Lokiarchaeota archaeon]